MSSRHDSCASPASEAHSAQRVPPIRTILDRVHHDEYGGTTGKAELITGVDGASTRLVRRIVLRPA
jgi:hypothetical protein